MLLLFFGIYLGSFYQRFCKFAVKENRSKFDIPRVYRIFTIGAGILLNVKNLFEKHSRAAFSLFEVVSCVFDIKLSIRKSYWFQQTFEAWRTVFLVSAGIYVVAAITFLLLGKFEVQSWNEIPSSESATRKNDVYYNKSNLMSVLFS